MRNDILGEKSGADMRVILPSVINFAECGGNGSISTPTMLPYG
jgi:hypothetical protein